MLDARQLGLKMIANVTYGYTAANFSGRMPCVEIADSIVSKGRETLERAIRLVNSTPEWRARVVYGDTDSLFVLLKGASKEEAFRIGKAITTQVTANNPTPVKLKFEKVSHQYFHANAFLSLSSKQTYHSSLPPPPSSPHLSPPSLPACLPACLPQVYMPCILQTKKRYVGMKYETLHSEPQFDAKGIETVRRDSCPAVTKVTVM